MNSCLNCGVALSGAFCGVCGQRSVPPNPTISDLAGDAWHELSGYDGRVAETFRGLLRPGRLTIEYLQGRRARYLSPIRLYLIVSVLYFVVSAAVPPTRTRAGAISGPGGVNISVAGSNSERPDDLTDEDRAQLLAEVDEQLWILRPMLRAMAEDQAGFRARAFTIMPRVFFAMLPVFAAIVALFYRRRHFPTALVFAAHLHAFAFLIFTISEASKLTQMPMVSRSSAWPRRSSSRSTRSLLCAPYSEWLGEHSSQGRGYRRRLPDCVAARLLHHPALGFAGVAAFSMQECAPGES